MKNQPTSLHNQIYTQRPKPFGSTLGNPLDASQGLDVYPLFWYHRNNRSPRHLLKLILGSKQYDYFCQIDQQIEFFWRKRQRIPLIVTV